MRNAITASVFLSMSCLAMAQTAVPKASNFIEQKSEQERAAAGIGGPAQAPGLPDAQTLSPPLAMPPMPGTLPPPSGYAGVANAKHDRYVTQIVVFDNVAMARVVDGGREAMVKVGQKLPSGDVVSGIDVNGVMAGRTEKGKKADRYRIWFLTPQQLLSQTNPANTMPR